MSKNENFADIVVHLHPENSCDDRDKIERELRNYNGVLSVHFNTEEHPVAMVVEYEPAAVTSDEILAEIRKCDKNAVMAGI